MFSILYSVWVTLTHRYWLTSAKRRRRRRFEQRGSKKWRKDVTEVVAHLTKALRPDDVVLGGGNAKKLKELPKGCRLGSNANAFLGGFRMWEDSEGNQRRKRKRSPMRRPSR